MQIVKRTSKVKLDNQIKGEKLATCIQEHYKEVGLQECASFNDKKERRHIMGKTPIVLYEAN
jgi:hypothetical protein